MVEQRNLGKSGLRVSVVGLGCNNFGTRIGLEAARAVMHKALDLGITLFDTSNVYGDPRGTSEEYIGRVLGHRRKDVVLATKFGSPTDTDGRPSGGSRRYIMAAVEASLRRLNTDWIDLYQQHRPDPLTPIEETLRALEDLIRQGKVRYIGSSNRPAWQLVESLWTARECGAFPFVSCQDEYSLLAREVERELIPAMQHYGLGLLPYFPLACGLLTGKYRSNAPMPENARLTTNELYRNKYMTEANLAVVERLERFCTERGHSVLELAFSWLASRSPVSSIIAGASNAEQLQQNVAAVGWSLSADDLAEIDRLTGVVPRS